MEPNMQHPLTVHLNHQPQRSSLGTLINNSNVHPQAYPQFSYPANNSTHNNHSVPSNNYHRADEEDEGDEDELDVDDDDEEDAEESILPPQKLEKPRPAILNHNSRAPNPSSVTKVNEVSNASGTRHDTHTENASASEHVVQQKSPHAGVSSKQESVQPTAEVDLLKENRELRRKVEHLMKHNIKLMQGIKDRDHKAYKQKLRLAKYRKALLRFFEQEPLSEASSSGGEDDLSDTSDDRKILPVRREKLLQARSPSPVDSVLSFTSPNASAIDYEFDDLSPDASSNSNKKRKIEGDLDSAPDRKRKAGTRRNALWSSEDDDKFTQAYNTFGKSWKSIHECLPDKTREQVQSRKLEDVKGNAKRGRKINKQHSVQQVASPVYHTQYPPQQPSPHHHLPPQHLPPQHHPHHHSPPVPSYVPQYSTQQQTQ